MSLGVVINSPEGIVLAAESRVTLTAQPPGQPPIHVNFDNATKLIQFHDPHNHVGVVTWGAAAINTRTAHSYVPEIEAALPSQRLKVTEYASRLTEFLAAQWASNMPGYSGPPMYLTIAGFDKGEPYGEVHQVELPRPGTLRKPIPGPSIFGITWGGQAEIVFRVLQGYDPALMEHVAQQLKLSPEQRAVLQTSLQAGTLPVPIEAMPLQDSIDFAVFLIRATITAQRLTVGLRGCGGAIDVAVITRNEGLRFIRRKSLQVSED